MVSLKVRAVTAAAVVALAWPFGAALADPSPAPPVYALKARVGQTVEMHIPCGPSDLKKSCLLVVGASSEAVSPKVSASGQASPNGAIGPYTDQCFVKQYNVLGGLMFSHQMNLSLAYDTDTQTAYLSTTDFNGTAVDNGWSIQSWPNGPYVTPGYYTWTNDLYASSAAEFYNQYAQNQHETTNLTYHNNGIHGESTCSGQVTP